MTSSNFQDFLEYFISSKGKIVIFTGAGISTSANIPDYRGTNGIYKKHKNKKKLPKLRLVEATSASPTLTHMAITTLVENGFVKHVVSQNVDGLHLRSGLSREKLSEIHGNLFIEKCFRCNTEFFRCFDVAETTGRSRHLTGRICSKCNCDNLDERLTNLVHYLTSKRSSKNISSASLMKIYRKAVYTLWTKDKTLPLLQDVIVHYFEKQNPLSLKTIYRLDDAVTSIHGSQLNEDEESSVSNDPDDSAKLIICVGSSLTVLRNYSFLWPDGLRKSSKTPVNVENLSVRLAINTLQPTCKDGLATYIFRSKCDEFFKNLLDGLNLEIPDYNPKVHDQIIRWAVPIQTKEMPTKTRQEIKPKDSLNPSGIDQILMA